MPHYMVTEKLQADMTYVDLRTQAANKLKSSVREAERKLWKEEFAIE